MIAQPAIDYFRCAPEFLNFHAAGPFKASSGYFQFGPEIICYGQTSGYTCSAVNDHLFDAAAHVRTHETGSLLPFDLPQVVDNLRYERYMEQMGRQRWAERPWIKELYYTLRPILPAPLRKQLQKISLQDWSTILFPRWPVDRSVDMLFEKLLMLAMQTLHLDRIPFIWFWPHGYTACTILTHDVETAAGRDFTPQVMDIDEAFGFRASFQIVPEDRYAVSENYLDGMRKRGFEVCIQGLNHDGRLFLNYREFLRRAEKINRYARQFGARGFRSPVMYRNVDWFRHLDFSYDMSMPNVAHLEPQRGGCCTIMPYFLPGGMLELPLTLTEDYSLFHILENYALDVWQQQVDILLQGHGLLNVLVHPDYLMPVRAQEVYKGLLAHLNRLRQEHDIWMALPGDVARWWRERHEMQLVATSNGWCIEGCGSSRARLAYARFDGERMVYEIEPHRGASDHASN